MPAATKTAAPSFNVVLQDLPKGAARSLHQVRLDEDIDVSVEHAADVADLLLRTVVLHELIRVQHVTANLAAEGDPLLDAADALQPRLLLLHLHVVEPR